MIENHVQLGDPVEHRGVVVAPLFPRNNPKADYLTLEEALPLGFRITETDAAGSVPELLTFNPLDTPVLLYDGEDCSGRSRTASSTSLFSSPRRARRGSGVMRRTGALACS